MYYKKEIYDYLNDKNIWHEITEHEAVFNMEELDAVELPYPDADAKNLFVRDDKRRFYYLITVKGDKRVDLKEFRKTYGTKPLTFVKPDELSDILGLIPGAVSPFGLLNDADKKVVFYIDEAFKSGSGLIGIHPNDNTATVWIKAEDLIRIVQESVNDEKAFFYNILWNNTLLDEWRNGALFSAACISSRPYGGSQAVFKADTVL